MKSFKDTAGREWKISVTLAEAEMLTDHFGINFNKIDKLFDDLETALSDLKRFWPVLWLLVEAQAVEQKIDAATLKRSLDADTMQEAAEAVVGAAIDFFPRRRPALLKIRTAIQERAEVIQAEAMERLDASLKEVASGNLDQKIFGFSISAGNAAELSESTPAPSPSGS